MKKLEYTGWAAFILVFIGSINLGLIGLINYNFLETIFGSESNLLKLLYILIGLSALYLLWFVSPRLSDQIIGDDPRRQKPLNDRRFSDRRKKLS